MPDAPAVSSVGASSTTALVGFTAPADTGGASIVSYTVTSSPGAITASRLKSPITVTGLTNGVAYTFSVQAET